MSKGSKDRTKDKDKFNENFDKIFGRKKIDITKLKNVYEETSKKNDRKNKG